MTELHTQSEPNQEGPPTVEVGKPFRPFDPEWVRIPVRETSRLSVPTTLRLPNDDLPLQLEIRIVHESHMPGTTTPEEPMATANAWFPEIPGLGYVATAKDWSATTRAEKLAAAAQVPNADLSRGMLYVDLQHPYETDLTPYLNELKDVHVQIVVHAQEYEAQGAPFVDDDGCHYIGFDQWYPTATGPLGQAGVEPNEQSTVGNPMMLSHQSGVTRGLQMTLVRHPLLVVSDPVQ